MVLLIALLFTALVLGLFAGSLLTEAVILVPYWRKMRPETFFDQHGTMGPRLYQYFAPLTICATLVPTATALYCFWISASATPYSVASDALILAIFGIYFFYFKGANAGFATRAAGVDGLADELRRWFIWHWIRTVMAILAFALSLLAIAAPLAG